VTATNNLDFPRCVRVIKTDDFSSVFNFRKRITGKFLVIHYQFSTVPGPRLGLIVAKKTTRLAVGRNYMKRVLRELFRTYENRPDLGNIDLIIRTQKTFVQTDFSMVKQEFEELLAQLRTKTMINHEKPG
jgi:ribonuclease P protein component